MMNIAKNIGIVDKCLFLPKSKTLIFPDIHIGYEEALNKQGILIPRTQFAELMKNVENIFKGLKNKDYEKLNEIIILGDLKHEFGAIGETEWRHTLGFLDYISKFTDKIILLKGNHDANLGQIADRKNLKVADYYAVDDILLCHGHEIPDIIMDGKIDGKTGKGRKIKIINKIKKIIIGHEHPAINLREGPRIEKFKCFIKGMFNGKELIVMPSFNPILEGTDVTKETLLSPFLKEADIKDFEVFVVHDKVYYFGKISGLIV